MLLELIRTPADLKRIPRERLPLLATEIRRKIVETVTRNGGHLGSGVGVVELTIALHYLYDFSRDRLFLDTGHQCYPHKLLTGRFESFHTLRTLGGISGFPNKGESPYDLMTSGHAGTALSMGIGTCLGDALRGEMRRTVVVVGDASIVSGVSFEALNSVGHLDQNLLVILNDNEQSIGRTVGALARLMSKVRMSRLYEGAKHTMERIERLLSSIPVIGQKVDKNVHDLFHQLKNALVPGQLFEELGFRYFGLYDGHDLDVLFEAIERIQDQPGIKMLHVLTVKGKGLRGCLEDPLALHGAKPGDRFVLDCDAASDVEKVDPEPPSSSEPAPKRSDFAKCFSGVLVEQAEQIPELVAITAGMPDGTGLVAFRERFPQRFFNVGIAEQHAVAFAGGLTLTGTKVVCAIYSTFMQRGFDQVFQEVALARNPVVFVMSHAGLAGEDGPTHHGLFDIAMLRSIPGLVLMAPRDGAELQAMVRFALRLSVPVAIRYPKAGTEPPTREVAPLELGKAEVLRGGEHIALVGYGPMSETALKAADLLAQEQIQPLVVNARFVRPLDQDLLKRLAARFRHVFTIEEAALAGGFGSAVLEHLTHVEPWRARVHPLAIPDRFIEHGRRETMLARLGLGPEGIRDTVLRLCKETTTSEKAYFGTAPR